MTPTEHQIKKQMEIFENKHKEEYLRYITIKYPGFKVANLQKIERF